MRLAVLQTKATVGVEAAAFDRIGMALSSASASGARMLLLPELILPGYNSPALHAERAQGRDGAWMTRLCDMAQVAGCGITLGWAERDGDAVYNTATTISPDGRMLAHYRKIQLYGPMENASFQTGNEPPPVFEFDGQLCGLLICYDVEFPEHVRSLAQRGATLVLAPTANPQGFEHVPRLLVPARAYENRLTLAYANYCSNEDGIAFGGLSVIAGPDGQPVAMAGITPTLLISDLPPPEAYPAGQLSTQSQDLRPIG